MIHAYYAFMDGNAKLHFKEDAVRMHSSLIIHHEVAVPQSICFRGHKQAKMLMNSLSAAK